MYVPPQALKCTCDSCSEGNCRIDLKGKAKDVHVVNLDCLKKATKAKGQIADCAILGKERGMFAIVELKGGQNIVIDKLVEQIQAGVDIIDSLSQDQPLEDFYPILMYKGKDPITALRGKLIRVRGIQRKVITSKCGSRLSKVPGLNRNFK